MRALKEERRVVEKAFSHLTEYVYHHDQNVNRNRNVKGASGEVTDGNEECGIGHWRGSDLCYKVTENLAELCFAIGRKVDL